VTTELLRDDELSLGVDVEELEYGSGWIGLLEVVELEEVYVVDELRRTDELPCVDWDELLCVELSSLGTAAELLASTAVDETRRS